MCPIQPVFLVPLCFALQHALCIKNVPPLSGCRWFFLSQLATLVNIVSQDNCLYILYIFVYCESQWKREREKFKVVSIEQEVKGLVGINGIDTLNGRNAQ